MGVADEDHHLHLRPMLAINHSRSDSLDRRSRFDTPELADANRERTPDVGSLS